jgi:carbon storage regulator CsrA
MEVEMGKLVLSRMEGEVVLIESDDKMESLRFVILEALDGFIWSGLDVDGRSPCLQSVAFKQKVGDPLWINNQISIEVVSINCGEVKLAFMAPKRIRILRSELAHSLTSRE